MQVWACMAVRSIPSSKAPVCWAALTQFGFRSASPKAGALRGLGQAVRAWDATSGWCAPEPRLAQTLLTPSGPSHTCATYWVHTQRGTHWGDGLSPLCQA